MTIQALQHFCNTLPGTTEDLKWEHDLCFCVAEKMYCVVGLNAVPTAVTFKVPAEDFEALSSREGFAPAPYVARYKWVMVEDMATLGPEDLFGFVRQSYQLVSAKLPKKTRLTLGLPT